MENIDFFKASMQIISAILSLYMTVIFIRLILSWIHSDVLTQAKVILGKITDPYLNLFRGFSWLKIGMFDLSPIVGIGLLSVMVSLTTTLARQGSINGWQILALVIGYVWLIIRFLIDFMIIIFVIRLITTLIQSLRNSTFFHQMDQMIYNISARILGFFTAKPISFQNALIICASIFVAIRIAASVGMMYLLKYLDSMGNVSL